MRFNIQRNQGSAFLISMITVGVTSFALAGYLALIQTQTTATMRSLAWNSAVPVAEAGVEEALSHININGLVANNGWELVQGKYLMKTRTIDGATCVVGISMTTPPVIVAQGKTQAPLGKGLVSRTIRVSTALNMLFSEGMIARLSVKLNGNEINVDSYDSSTETYSTGGRYDPAKHKDNGVVATNSGDPNMFSTGNANIWGRIATGYGGLASVGPNSCIGNDAWHLGGNKGLQDGASDDDMNKLFADVECPINISSFAPGSGLAADGTNYNHILVGASASSGTEFVDYVISDSAGFGGKVLVTGKARLLVTSNVQFSGSDYIYIADGASLELYVSAPKASLGGRGIQNDAGKPANFIYYGLPANTSLSYSGNAGMSGAIYAPNADFSLGGGGNNVYDFAGACVTKSVSMNGKFNFHFDEDLKNGPGKGFIATSWDEIRQGWDDILASSGDLALLH